MVTNSCYSIVRFVFISLIFFKMYLFCNWRDYFSRRTFGRKATLMIWQRLKGKKVRPWKTILSVYCTCIFAHEDILWRFAGSFKFQAPFIICVRCNSSPQQLGKRTCRLVSSMKKSFFKFLSSCFYKNVYLFSAKRIQKPHIFLAESVSFQAEVLLVVRNILHCALHEIQKK